jgi:hypothetical protein
VVYRRAFSTNSFRVRENTMKTVFALVAATMLYALSAAAQTGSLYGKVHDSRTGEELVGANVLLVGTSLGASTDIDGKFTVRNVPPGTYSVRFSYVGYTAQVVSGVEVKAGDNLKLDLNLTSEDFQQDEVVVTAERILSTEASVLADRRKSATIGDAISAEQIRKAPDATSGDALKRVTGLTVVDDKFVYVRGVTDRYNGTALNGVSVSSTNTEVDRKSFSFDLVPSSLLENTVVVKTATPDLPGDFSGGFVQVNTLDFPSSFLAKLSFSGGYSSSTTGSDFLRSQGGGRDFLGVDDGARSLPGGDLPPQELARTLPNTWAPRSSTAPVASRINLAIGDRLALGESDEFGYIGAFAYSREFERNEFSIAPTYVDGAAPAYRFAGTRDDYSVLWSGLLDLNYKVNGLHKFSVKNSYNQAAEDRVSEFDGMNYAGSDAERTAVQWNQRSLYLVQVSGTHLLPGLNGMEAEWKGYYSSSDALEPDRKQVEYTRSSGAYALGENYRTWSDLYEKTRGARADVTYPLGGINVKAGAQYELRQRSFGIEAYSTLGSRNPQYFSLALQPLDSVFQAPNYDPGKFSFISSTTFTGAYDGRNDLSAYYAMADIPFELAGQAFRFVGGARLENNRMSVTSPTAVDDPTPQTSSLNVADVLPSANLTYVMSDIMNLRLAMYHSVNRPEFREFSNVLYLDFNQDQNVIGNPDLGRAYVHNYDVRYEVFPDIGEVVAASFFYKDFSSAIEERLIPAPDRYVQTWFNSPSGKNYGWELELRKSMRFLGGYFGNFSLTGNYTRVYSEVEYTDSRTDAQGNAILTQATRPMQGQSPWMINLGVYFSEPDWGTTVSLLYNKFGRRLRSVGDVRDQDVYEEPKDMLDLSVTQRFTSYLEARLAFKNLLGEDSQYTTGEQQVFFGFNREAREASLTLSLSL